MKKKRRGLESEGIGQPQSTKLRGTAVGPLLASVARSTARMCPRKASIFFFKGINTGEITSPISNYREALCTGLGV